MKKIALGILIAVVAAILTVGVVSALPSNKGIERAKEVSLTITDEGLKAPPEFVAELPESELTKIVFIRYAPGSSKIKPVRPSCDDGVIHPSEQCGEAGLPECPAGEECINCKCVALEEPVPTTACYAFLAGSKPKWNWVENYVYNDEILAEPSSDAVIVWETPVSGDIFGSGSYETGYDWGVYDYMNSISFGDYEDPNVIAVAAIWFRAKNIYEYDIMFDTDFFPGNFDLPTVTLHEFGHGAGLGDLYDVACIGNVMYGYLSEGEVKTTLGGGDIMGIQTLYGK